MSDKYITTPIEKPKKKDPQKRSRVMTMPPPTRSRAALGLAVAAAEGRFVLQICQECGATQYPARDACSSCLSTALKWQDADPVGTLIAETTTRTSTNIYFRERSPWRVGTVRMDAGVSMMVHLHGECVKGDKVRIINRLDKSGQAVLMALPMETSPHFEDDPQMREMTCDPKFRRVLITDGRGPDGYALAKAFSDAGASIVFVGEQEDWLNWDKDRAKLAAIPNVEIIPLDVTDSASVQKMAGEIGFKTDILVNNARYVRPGGVMDYGDIVMARDAMDVNYFGLMRLAQAFGPVMRARGGDGQNSAAAFVNIMSVYAHNNRADFAAYAASDAAALSLTQALRAEFKQAGVRVLNTFTGPTEDEWHQPLPPPKVAPSRLARDIVGALKQGLEEIYVGDVAQDFMMRWRDDPKVLEREMMEGEG